MSYRTYNQEILNEAVCYLNNYDVIYGDKVPTKAGLCRILEISPTTAYAWAETHQAFGLVMEQLGLERQRQLINNGLIGRFNSNITKLMLADEGYSDRTTVDHNINMSDLTDEQLAHITRHGRLPAPA